MNADIDANLNPLGLRRLAVVDHGPDTASSSDLGRMTREDWVAEERPVALVFNGISHAVMMATPADLEDFALGFAITEGLLHGAHECLDIEIDASAEGVSVQLTVTAEAEWRLKGRRRSLEGRTGCGLCGVDSLEQVQRACPRAPDTVVPTQAVAKALRALRPAQDLQQLCGATHAAALMDLDGQLVMVREDVGRHNALDKLIGGMVKAKLAPSQHFICITSRASFEMVQKTLAAGVGVLVAVSAPTAMAVDTAQAGNLALAGFARGEHFVAYAHPHRFVRPI